MGTALFFLKKAHTKLWNNKGNADKNSGKYTIIKDTKIQKEKKMSNKIQEREARRLDVIDCISRGFSTTTIARRLEVPLWTILGDLKRMQHNRDSKLKDAYKHAREQTLVKKQLTSNLPDKKFQRMTGMTFQEKTRNNMMSFYRPELWKILKSENQGDAIRELPNSVRKTMKRNGLITSGWKYLEVTAYTRACLTDTPAVDS